MVYAGSEDSVTMAFDEQAQADAVWTNTNSDGSTCRVTMNGSLIHMVWFRLRGELPRLTKSSRRMSANRRIANILANKEKHALQKHFVMRIFGLGLRRYLHDLQRQNAHLGVITRVTGAVARKVQLDIKNVYAAMNELILDPLQRTNPPVIFSDRPSNLLEEYAQRKRSSEVFNGDSYIEMAWAPTNLPCGAAVKRRLREEMRLH